MNAVTNSFSANPDYDFEIRTALGHAVEGASEPGEVLAATAGIKKGDHKGWFGAWNGLATRTLATARAADAAGHRVSAAQAYLRASAYFGVAVDAISALDDTTALGPTFASQRAAWNSFVDNASVEVERVEIPYESATLPGYFFRSGAGAGVAAVAGAGAAAGAAAPAGSAEAAAAPASAAAAPTLVAVNGSDGSLASLWASTVSAALKRGYNVLMFDGPGQQSQLFDRGIPFRPDWENVLTPVFDFVAAQAGVDPSRIAVYGISQGGYWVPRAIAFEHRFAAAIADPGVVDVSSSWMGHLPKSLTKLLDEKQNEKFDREMAFGLKFSPESARTWNFRTRPYATTGYAETLDAVRAYNVADLAAQITTPLLITDPEGEQFWPGQSEQLAALTPGVSTIIHFTAAEGASGHCQPLARTLTAERMFDWLDERLAARRGAELS
ncbi:alpha/beta hydrolase family protein [Subtercola endophyticus]|uniref:alpha/beta hydrolase family protein n=1 Tax=Subtercola endophyticus TaxID=2895559 RepID=UPI001E607785|nr:prolyl oligopeptidase family serine peptidase [Subtercola endophyticus]UFS58637.1 prolyl oligopeptidase family serine peptidase [Subtercola endophyticus]